MGLPLAMAAIAGGSSLFGQYQANKAANEERDFWKRIARRRAGSPEMAALSRMFGQSEDALRELPGLFRRKRQGALASQAQERFRRLRENLAPSGATMASSVAMNASGRIAESLEQQRQMGELGEATTMQGLRGQVSGMGQQLLQAKYPSPGQITQGRASVQGMYTNPMRPLASALTAYGMGQYFQGGQAKEDGGGFNPFPWFE